MNNKTKIKYTLSRMYEFTNDILDICKSNNNDYEIMLTNHVTKHAINMCLAQIGELAGRLRDIDIDLYQNSAIPFPLMKGMRDRIIHSYVDIEYDVIFNTLEFDIPALNKYLIENIDKEVLENPYILFEKEYDDLIKDRPNFGNMGGMDEPTWFIEKIEVL